MASTLLALVLSVGAASHSRLGIHVLGDTQDVAAQKILAACPRVVKWLVPDSSVALEIAKYKNSCIGGTVVVRPYVTGYSYAVTDNPVAKAQDYWGRVMGQLAGLDPLLVDYLEPLNEIEGVPNWYHDATAADWMAQFWSALADSVHNAGYKPLIGSIAVGNPALAGDLGAGSPNLFKPTTDLMRAKPYAWAWSYHAYSKDLTQDPAQEIYYSLRFQRIAGECGLANIPVVLSEGGQDIPTGWQGRGTSAAAYLAWLEWFDRQIAKDPVMIGVTIFQVGEHTTWSNFDLGPIADDLAAYIQSPTVPDAGSTGADAGTTGDGGTGGDGGLYADGGDGGADGGGGNGGNGNPLGGDTSTGRKLGCGCGAGSVGALALLALAARRRRS